MKFYEILHTSSSASYLSFVVVLGTTKFILLLLRLKIDVFCAIFFFFLENDQFQLYIAYFWEAVTFLVLSNVYKQFIIGKISMSIFLY